MHFAEYVVALFVLALAHPALAYDAALLSILL